MLGGGGVQKSYNGIEPVFFFDILDLGNRIRDPGVDMRPADPDP